MADKSANKPKKGAHLIKKQAPKPEKPPQAVRTEAKQPKKKRRVPIGVKIAVGAVSYTHLIIFSWDELRDIAARDVNAAREALVNVLSNYQGVQIGRAHV